MRRIPRRHNRASILRQSCKWRRRAYASGQTKPGSPNKIADSPNIPGLRWNADAASSGKAMQADGKY